MTFEELQLEYDRLFDNYTQRHSEIIALKVEKEKLEKENDNLKNEIDSLDYDIRMLNVKHEELQFEYEDSEYDRDSLYWQYWELKEKCDKAYQIANQYLMNQSSLEEVLDGIMLLKID